MVGLRQEEAPDDDKDGRGGAEPEEAAPAVRGCGYEGPVEDGGEEVADGVALLEEAREDSAGFVGEIFEGSGGGGAEETLGFMLVGRWVGGGGSGAVVRTPIAIP